MACQAISACVADTGREDLLKHVDSLSVVNISVESMKHPEESLCRMLGINPVVREQTSVSGTSPQWLVNRAADKIAAGEIKMALLVGLQMSLGRYRKFLADYYKSMAQIAEGNPLAWSNQGEKNRRQCHHSH
jgi:acetyl-CoA acetyltransferase